MGVVTLTLAVYALIARSAGIYQTSTQLRRALLLSAGVSYALSSGLFLVFPSGLTVVLAMMLTLFVPLVLNT
jgi:hypothetical protein